jgi:hypothetical protein
MKVFISHIAEEGGIAVLFKNRIEKSFLQKIECFVSSDTDSVLAGENWLQSVDAALKNASVEVILCSPVSVKRPWINFEAGAGWMRGIPIIPVCHSGLTPRSLPMPMTILQAVLATDSAGLKRLYAAIAKAHQSSIPEAPFDDLAAEVAVWEDVYRSHMPQSSAEGSARDKHVLTRMLKALADPAHRFRSIERLSFLGGVSESEAVDLLRGDPEVVFAKGKSGKLIARLKSR